MTVQANEGTREPISLTRTLFIIHIDIIQILSILFIDVNSLPSSSNLLIAPSRVRCVSSNHSNPVDPVYRCKFAPVVVKLGTRERQSPGSWHPPLAFDVLMFYHGFVR